MREEEVAAFQETAFRAFLATLASFIAYGIHVSVACASMYVIIVTKRQDPFNKFHVAFIATLLLLGTLNITLWSSMMIEGWKMLFLRPDDGAFENLPGSFIAYGAGCSTASAAITTLCIGLLLYRCCIIWESMIYVAVLPALLYLAVIGLGVSDLSVFWSYRSHHGLTPYPLVYRLTAAYWFSLLSLNILLTLLIVSRIVYLRWINRSAAPSQTLTGRLPMSTKTRSGANSILSVVTLLVESSLLYTLAVVVGLAFNWWFFEAHVLPRQAIPLMIAFEVSPFNPYLTHLECIASELIILRVALGRAWKPTKGEGSTIISEGLQFRGVGDSTTAMEGSIMSPRNSGRSRRHSIGIPLHAIRQQKDEGGDEDEDRWSLGKKSGDEWASRSA